MSLLDFDAPPARYAVMGNPIGHSRSPQIHTLFAAQLKQRLEYRAILVELGGLAAAVSHFQASGGAGLNITVPFKEEAFRLADQLSERAEWAGAVNTLRFGRAGEVIGDNTDGVGLVTDLTVNLARPLAQQRILILGAGGAVRGIIAPLFAHQPAALVIANRTPDKAHHLAQQFAQFGPISGGSYAALAGMEPFHLLLNATSASLGGELPPLPEGLLAPNALCYDLMYGAAPTPFMHWGRAQGGQSCDGLGMLVEQAAEAFTLWRGLRPATQPVIAAIRAELDPAGGCR